MYTNTPNYYQIKEYLTERHVNLIAVSKTKPIEAIQELYDLGQRDFGENYVQELVDKYEALPKDIRWHFIGHLQTNKVKYIAPFVHLIHGIDSEKLLIEVNKQGLKNNRVVNCLLQMHIAQEETKFGMDEGEIDHIVEATLPPLTHVNVMGLMGMASFSNNESQVKKEFQSLHKTYSKLNASSSKLTVLSCGMSGDYKIAIGSGSNMVRIGSLLFGSRN
jgi:PLP dependent protein